ncbi:MAG TPA: hypothetical protein VGK46_05190 [Saprospiraceae bacterium]
MISINKAIYLFVVILSIIGCGKDDFENSISFKIDGEQYIGSYAELSINDVWGLDTILDLYCEFDFNPDGLHPEFLQITLSPFDEMKSEYLIDGQNRIFMYLHKNDGISYSANPGTGIFSIEESADSKMKGSFECILSPLGANSGSPVLTITEGKFNLKRE